MANVVFETLTDAQAANFNGPIDTLVFTSPTASGKLITVTYVAAVVTPSTNTPASITIASPGARTVTFPAVTSPALGGIAGDLGTFFSFDGSTLYVGSDTANDVASGTAFDDGLYGGGGDDNLSGLAGNDLLQGNSGNDTQIGRAHV